jgi:sialidase-1
MIQKFNVSRDDSIYEAWPDIVLTDGGKLICVFAECEHHKNQGVVHKRVLHEENDDGEYCKH